MTHPLVTAVIPVHNHEKWIVGAIDSVASQDYPNKRIVVVDDGSVDGSFELVLSAIGFDVPSCLAGKVRGVPFCGDRFGVPVTAYRFEKASGPSFARNFGMKSAWEETHLFSLLDSDDAYEPGKMSKSVAKWLEGPDHIAAVYSDYETLNEETGVRIREYKEPYSRARLVRECIVNCDSLVSKAALAECGVFDEELRVVEDWDLWLRLSERFLLAHIGEALVTIRVGSHSSTANVPTERWKASWRRVMEKAEQRRMGRV